MGSIGPIGPIGPMGPMGMTGPMGVAGAAGAAGVMGAIGPAGPAGAMGPQGVPGSQGPGGAVTGEGAAQFAGFTAATFTGVAGSREGMHARCAAEFAGSHLCHVAEYHLANSATIPPAAGAWLDMSGGVEGYNANTLVENQLASVDLGRWTGMSYSGNCDNWTATIDGAAPTFGEIIKPATTTTVQCTTTHSLACCSTPYAEGFRGFTTASVTGARTGGRAEMHQVCGAQFAGSHMCHVAEYQRSTPATTPPAGGAWLDMSGYLRSSGTVDNVIATSHFGRWTGMSYSGNCDSWTATIDGAAPTFGEVITVTGTTTTACTGTHPVACCE